MGGNFVGSRPKSGYMQYCGFHGKIGVIFAMRIFTQNQRVMRSTADITELYDIAY